MNTYFFGPLRSDALEFFMVFVTCMVIQLCNVNQQNSRMLN